MSQISKEKPSPAQLEALQVHTWSPWECEPSTFAWTYDAEETAYVLEGQVTVTCPDGQQVDLGPGDLVRFPRGLSCTWHVKKKIRKVYRFA
ncbi:MAG: cupin domain-containing protein [Desulfobacca sp.]|uniref:cupin domain-containing protein n=1 Tax=Desulfobacca sp. TaxID=2067990 RepID=UPI00404B70D4